MTGYASHIQALDEYTESRIPEREGREHTHHNDVLKRINAWVEDWKRLSVNFRPAKSTPSVEDETREQ